MAETVAIAGIVIVWAFAYGAAACIRAGWRREYDPPAKGRR